jgi:esterase/lipase superfamily enzyme
MRELKFGMCEVSIPGGDRHNIGRLEAPSVWRLEFREDPAKHIVLLGVRPQSKIEFFEAVQTRVNDSAAKDAFVFVHGYNVSFEDAARRTGQLAYDLQFDGAPILYVCNALKKLVCMVEKAALYAVSEMAA